MRKLVVALAVGASALIVGCGPDGNPYVDTAPGQSPAVRVADSHEITVILSDGREIPCITVEENLGGQSAYYGLDCDWHADEG